MKSLNKTQEMDKTKAIIWIIVFMVLLTVAVVVFFIFDSQYSKLIEENKLLKTILTADKDWTENSIPEQRAESYYELAGYAYEDGDYNYVISNCVMARDYFMETVNGFEKIKSKLLDSKINHTLIDLYISMIDQQLEMNYNLYEACEYFESASRYYDKYYNTGVPYNDPSYDMGGEEIKKMNEKIMAHDDAVEIYNSLSSDFIIELEKI